MPVELLDLWLPIIVAAVAVFFASFIAHMVLKHHKNDFRKLPNEDAVMDAVRGMGASSGQYMFPYCGGPGEMNEPAMKAKLERGPIGTMTICPAGGIRMGRNLLLTFLTYALIAVFVAYLASVALPLGAEFLTVFRFTATAAIMAHCLGFFGHAIWHSQPRRAFLNDLADGIAYGLITGALFAWLWPASTGVLG